MKWKKNIECSDFDQRTSKDFNYAPTRGLCALEIYNVTSEGMIAIQIYLAWVFAQSTFNVSF